MSIYHPCFPAGESDIIARKRELFTSVKPLMLAN